MNDESNLQNNKNVTRGCLKLNNKMYPVFEGHNTIGRNPDAVVNIKTLSISKYHAVITIFDGNRHYISDFKSSNGTVLDRNKLSPLKLYQLNNGASIKFGDVFCTYKKLDETEIIEDNGEASEDFTQSFYATNTQEVHFTNLPDGINFNEMPTQIFTSRELSVNEMPTQLHDFGDCKDESSDDSLDFVTMQKAKESQMFAFKEDEPLSQIRPLKTGGRNMIESDSDTEEYVPNKSKYHISDDSETDIEDNDEKTKNESPIASFRLEANESVTEEKNDQREVIDKPTEKLPRAAVVEDHVYCRLKATQDDPQGTQEVDVRPDDNLPSTEEFDPAQYEENVAVQNKKMEKEAASSDVKKNEDVTEKIDIPKEIEDVLVQPVARTSFLGEKPQSQDKVDEESEKIDIANEIEDVLVQPAATTSFLGEKPQSQDKIDEKREKIDIAKEIEDVFDQPTATSFLGEKPQSQAKVDEESEKIDIGKEIQDVFDQPTATSFLGEKSQSQDKLVEESKKIDIPKEIEDGKEIGHVFEQPKATSRFLGEKPQSQDKIDEKNKKIEDNKEVDDIFDLATQQLDLDFVGNKTSDSDEDTQELYLAATQDLRGKLNEENHLLETKVSKEDDIFMQPTQTLDFDEEDAGDDTSKGDENQVEKHETLGVSLREDNIEIDKKSSSGIEKTIDRDNNDDLMLPPTQALEYLHRDDKSESTLDLDKKLLPHPNNKEDDLPATQALEDLLSDDKKSEFNTFLAPPSDFKTPSPLRKKQNKKTPKEDDDSFFLPPTQALEVMHEGDAPFNEVEDQLHQIFASQSLLATQQLVDVLETTCDEDVIDDSICETSEKSSYTNLPSLSFKTPKPISVESVKEILAEDIDEDPKENKSLRTRKKDRSQEKLLVSEEKIEKGKGRKLRGASKESTTGSQDETESVKEILAEDPKESKSLRTRKKDRSEEKLLVSEEKVEKGKGRKLRGKCKESSTGSQDETESVKEKLAKDPKENEALRTRKKDRSEEKLLVSEEKVEKGKGRKLRGKSKESSTGSQDETESVKEILAKDPKENEALRTRKRDRSEEKLLVSEEKVEKGRGRKLRGTSKEPTTGSQDETESVKEILAKDPNDDPKENKTLGTRKKDRPEEKLIVIEEKIEKGKGRKLRGKSRESSTGSQDETESVKEILAKDPKENKALRTRKRDRSEEKLLVSEEKVEKGKGRKLRGKSRESSTGSQDEIESVKEILAKDPGDDPKENKALRTRKRDRSEEKLVSEEKVEKGKGRKLRGKSRESSTGSQDETESVQEILAKDPDDDPKENKALRTRKRDRSEEKLFVSEEKVEKGKGRKLRGTSKEPSTDSQDDTEINNDKNESRSENDLGNKGRRKRNLVSNNDRIEGDEPNNEENTTRERRKQKVASTLDDNKNERKNQGTVEKDDPKNVNSEDIGTSTRRGRSKQNVVGNTNEEMQEMNTLSKINKEPIVSKRGNKRKNNENDKCDETPVKINKKTEENSNETRRKRTLATPNYDSEDEFVVKASEIEPVKSTPAKVRKSARKAKEKDSNSEDDLIVVSSGSSVTSVNSAIEETPKRTRRLSANSRRQKKEEESKQNTTKKGGLLSPIPPTPERNKRQTKPKVVFTMMDNPELESLIRQLGGSVVDSVDACTVLVTATVKRSQKLLCAVAQGKPICSPQWLQACKKTFAFVDPWDYILVDKEAEKKWNFSLRESLNRSTKVKLLENHIFQIIVNNAGDVLKGAIESCGGKCVTRNLAKSGGEHLVVVSSEHNKNKYNKFVKENSKIKVVEAEAIFDGTLRQEFRFNDYLLA